MDEDKRTIRVVAAVIENDGRYLVTRRRPTAVLPDLWEFPGGKLEAGEDHLAAARRELREELDLEVPAGGELLHSEIDPASSFVIDFVAVEIEGEPHCHEHVACRWVELDELLQLPLAPADASFVRDGLNFSTFSGLGRPE